MKITIEVLDDDRVAIEIPREFWRYLFAGLAVGASEPNAVADALLAELEMTGAHPASCDCEECHGN
jgi:hypothetical protein